MSVRQDAAKTAAAGAASPLEIADSVAQSESQYAEGTGHDIAQPENPLSRNVVVSIRASLNELCLQKQKGTWAPSQEALRSIFQQVSSGVPFFPRAPARPPVLHPGCRRTAPARPSAEALHQPRGRGRAHGRPQGTPAATPLPHTPHAERPPCACAVGRPARHEGHAHQVHLPVLAGRPRHGRRRQDLLVHRRGVLCDRPAHGRVHARQGAAVRRRVPGIRASACDSKQPSSPTYTQQD